MPETAGAEEVVRQIIERAWNEGELAVIDARIAPDFVRHTAIGDMPGPAAFKARINTMRVALAGFHAQIHETAGDGDGSRAFCRFRVTGRHVGEFLGFAPTGNEVAFEGAVLAHAVDGQLVEEWEYFDTASLLAQLTAAV